MSVFPQQSNNHLSQSMFFGENVNVARYDSMRFPWIDKLTERQLSFFWRPEEIDITKDSIDFNERLTEAEQHMFTSNIKYQTLLDSVQGRSPNLALLPIVSLPELETWIETWAFSETIHSRSYTHIIRNVFNAPSEILNEITSNEHIIARASSVTDEYDKLIALTQLNSKATQHEKEDALFRTMVSVNVLEAVRFYVSFACSFSFAERELMEGNAKIIKLIARDEALHLSGTQRIIQHWINGDDNEAMQEAAIRNFGYIAEAFEEAAEQEKEWARYLFSHGSVIGLNEKMLSEYVEYITDIRMKALGLMPLYGRKNNPLPWMNNWLNSSTYQVAPQETQITSYLSGAVDSSVSADDFDGMTI